MFIVELTFFHILDLQCVLKNLMNCTYFVLHGSEPHLTSYHVVGL